jgi:hypothetical protein
MRAALNVAVAASLLAPAAASAQATSDTTRTELDGFAAALEAAVRKVSRPSPAMLTGREAARCYRLPGFGAVFVLAPRALPAAPRRSPFEREAARAVDQAIRHLEIAMRNAPSAEARKQMEKNLQALRQTRTDLRENPGEPMPNVFVLTPPAPEFMVTADGQGMDLRLEDLQRELEAQMAEQLRALEEAERIQGEREREMEQALEMRAREQQARMEAVRRDVEQARVAAELQVEQRLAGPATVPAPSPPAAPVAATPAAAPPAPSAEAAPPTPVLPPMTLTPPPAPWQFWFAGEDPGDGRTSDAVIRDVKTAVTVLVEKQGPALRALRPEEYVAVAVDFVPRGSMVVSPRVQKTLVIKVRKHDLDERRAGRLTAEALRQRIDYTEY